jgi:hypothetical protein
MLDEAVTYAEEIEAGQFPPFFPDRAAACAHLKGLLAAEDYGTDDERYRAQALIVRLSRLSTGGWR